MFTELQYVRGAHQEFVSLSQELAAPGELRHTGTFDFEFKNVEKPYESYTGINVKLRYLLRVTISRRLSDLTKERDVWVYSYRIPPEVNASIKMEVGIEDCLHIEFEYNKSKCVFSLYLFVLDILSFFLFTSPMLSFFFFFSFLLSYPL
jgi:vacuolar protein sorting-associated protein 26